jgi:hypothetical protein
MNLQPLLLALVMVLLFSCKSKTAFDYSQQIVTMETELAADIAISDKKVSDYIDAEQNDSAAIITKRMEDLAVKTLEEVKKLDAPKVNEGENFKKAAVRYFTYLNTIYTSFHKFTSATTAKAKESERLKLAKIVNDKEEATKALQVAQQKFATANNFRIGKVSKADNDN